MRTLVECRSRQLSRVRQFFYERGFYEVDVPILSCAPCIDLYIEPFSTKEGFYLHTSPEIAMKRLLCQGSGDIFFLGHVFRQEEQGSLHHEEFSMIEWYRTQTTQELFLEEAVDLCGLFLGNQSYELLDYHAFSLQGATPAHWSERERRHYLWSHEVEPHLGKDKLTIITNYPKEEAALAQINAQGYAERFEIYYKGIELGNGYHELSDPEEQRRRFEEGNRLRQEEGKEPLPLDEKFLEALSLGLPPETYGMSLGFDRLFLLQQGKGSLSDILLL